MPDNEFQTESLGGVYAQALINEAQKLNVLAEVREDIGGIGQLLRENKAFLQFTQALTIGEEERLASLTRIFGGTPPRVHPLVLNVLKSMSRRDRLMFLRGLVEAFEEILKKMSGHIDAELISASDLGPQVLERIALAAGRSLGKTVDLNLKIDPALIGGMTLQIGDTLMDASVATQLEKIREQLKRGGMIRSEAVIA